MKIFILFFSLSLFYGCQSQIDVVIQDDESTKNDSKSKNNTQLILGNVESVYPLNNKWNDYVKNDEPGKNTFNQDDTPCNGSETGTYLSCIHGGEKRMVSVTGTTSCEGLSAKDQLGAFDWRCEAIDGNVKIYSIRLKKGKGLSDLINSTSWTPNKVIVTTADQDFESPSSSWWTNPILSLPDNSSTTVTSLNASSSIYILNSSQLTTGYNITADKVSIVIKKNATLGLSNATVNNCNDSNGETGTPDKICMISAGTQKFIWIEGYFNAISASGVQTDYGTYLFNVKFSQFKGISIQNSDENGLRFYSSDSNFFEDIVIANTTGSYNYRANSSDYNILHSIASYTAGGGFYMNYSNFNSITKYIGVSSVYLLFTGNGVENTRSHVTAAHTTYTGVDNYQSDYSTTNQVLTVNNDHIGIDHSGTGGDRSIFNTSSQLAIFNNEYGMQQWFSDDNKIYGNLLISGNTSQCGSGFNTNESVDGTCTALTPASLNVINSGFDISNTFVGKITSEDTSNSSDVNASPTSFPANLATFDWTRMDNFYRGWGKEGSTFPNHDQAGVWNAGNGWIWDWSLQSTDTEVLNKSGDGSSLNSAFINKSICPLEVRGDKYIINQETSPKKYLINAQEIIYDGIGNDNGLCESNESCIYSPNFGAYQGHGNYQDNTCIFDDAGDVINNVTNVKMYSYQFNGR